MAYYQVEHTISRTLLKYTQREGMDPASSSYSGGAMTAAKDPEIPQPDPEA